MFSQPFERADKSVAIDEPAIQSIILLGFAAAAVMRRSAMRVTMLLRLPVQGTS
jgi:hypothetical protein